MATWFEASCLRANSKILSAMASAWHLLGAHQHSSRNLSPSRTSSPSRSISARIAAASTALNRESTPRPRRAAMASTSAADSAKVYIFRPLFRTKFVSSGLPRSTAKTASRYSECASTQTSRMLSSRPPRPIGNGLPRMDWRSQRTSW